MYMVIEVKNRKKANQILERILATYSEEITKYGILDKREDIAWKRTIWRTKSSYYITLPHFVIDFLDLRDSMSFIINENSGMVYVDKPKKK
jgi:hypothetical protein